MSGGELVFCLLLFLAHHTHLTARRDGAQRVHAWWDRGSPTGKGPRVSGGEIEGLERRAFVCFEIESSSRAYLDIMLEFKVISSSSLLLSVSRGCLSLLFPSIILRGRPTRIRWATSAILAEYCCCGTPKVVSPSIHRSSRLRLLRLLRDFSFIRRLNSHSQKFCCRGGFGFAFIRRKRRVINYVVGDVNSERSELKGVSDIIIARPL